MKKDQAAPHHPAGLLKVRLRVMEEKGGKGKDNRVTEEQGLGGCILIKNGVY